VTTPAPGGAVFHFSEVEVANCYAAVHEIDTVSSGITIHFRIEGLFEDPDNPLQALASGVFGTTSAETTGQDYAADRNACPGVILAPPAT
jgi:hypothetical protein